MNEISITNKTNETVDSSLLNNIIDYALKHEKIDNGVVNVMIVNNEEIKSINKRYRGIDNPTDVISFALEDDDTFVSIPIRVLGDIYISIDKVYEQAKEYGHSVKRELAFLTVHGILHLLGYDHMNKEDEIVMFKKQDEILDNFNIRRDYA